MQCCRCCCLLARDLQPWPRCRSMLDGETQPGVWFPEERGALQRRTQFFDRAKKGCQRFILNKPTWQLESDPKQLGFGIYY
jgi:hypothetical protein